MSCDIGEVAESSAHSPTFPSLHLRHSSFSNSSVVSPTSQFILQLFRCFTYITAHSPTLVSLLLRHRLFTYVTWRAAHANTYIKQKYVYYLSSKDVLYLYRISCIVDHQYNLKTLHDTIMCFQEIIVIILTDLQEHFSIPSLQSLLNFFETRTTFFKVRAVPRATLLLFPSKANLSIL